MRRFPLLHRLRQPLAAALLLPALAAAVQAQRLAPIVYTITVPSVLAPVAVVDAQIPTDKKPVVELMMPVWSPGFYRVEDYASKVQDLSARGADGAALTVEQPAKNRWRITTNGAASISISYRLLCDGRSVTTNAITPTYGVFNGSATYITIAEQAQRPHDVHIALPAEWPQAMTSLGAAPDGRANHFRALSYDELNDSPILAGKLSVHEFTVAGSLHQLVDAGELGAWDGELAAQNLEKFVKVNAAFWGRLPFKRYVFLSLFRRGGGGLEHLNSTLLTSSASPDAPGGTLRWLNFVSHEYFHAFNVKRLRPVELGPFDYEHPPTTASLWISEGLTSYFGELFTRRAGLASLSDYLATLSAHVAAVQNSPGRLVQTLEQSSLAVWTSGGTSGVGNDPNTTVSYYEKGAVVGFLLDAHIRRVTEGKRSLDDVMRLAYQRYSGRRGFTPIQFRQAAEDVAADDLSRWFARVISSTEELDYSEALDWYGLRFAPTDDPTKRWMLELAPGATAEQRMHLAALSAYAP